MNFKTNIAGNKILLRFVSCSHANTSCVSFTSCGAFSHFLNVAIFPLLSFRILSLSHSVFIPETGFPLVPVPISASHPLSWLYWNRLHYFFVCVSVCGRTHVYVCVNGRSHYWPGKSWNNNSPASASWFHVLHDLPPHLKLFVCFAISSIFSFWFGFLFFPVNIDLLNNFRLLKSII